MFSLKNSTANLALLVGAATIVFFLGSIFLSADAETNACPAATANIYRMNAKAYDESRADREEAAENVRAAKLALEKAETQYRKAMNFADLFTTNMENARLACPDLPVFTKDDPLPLDPGAGSFPSGNSSRPSDAKTGKSSPFAPTPGNFGLKTGIFIRLPKTGTGAYQRLKLRSLDRQKIRQDNMLKR